VWKIISGSAIGTSHLSLSQPCQDACQVAQWVVDGDTMLAIVCCDGAGSAKYAEQGARRACDAFLKVAKAKIADQSAFDLLDRATALSLCLEVQAQVQELADAASAPLRDFASTLLAVLIHHGSCICIQIGDGAIVTSVDGSAYKIVFWPQSGEYINTTNFLTDDGMPQALAFSRSENGAVNECAVFTDGLERLALHFDTQSVHVPFFRPLFAALRSCADAEQLNTPLRQFLESSPVNGRTEDDKSLVLATRLGVEPDASALH
jgi:hypothetical protein